MHPIYFIRHGETEYNREKRLQGWRDSPLSDTGQAQAARVAEAVATLDVSEGYVSPLGRARQTADIIRARWPVDLVPCDDLREVSFGDFEGNTLPELDVKFPGLWQARQDEKWTYCPPGGESNEQASAVRGCKAVERLVKDAARRPVLVVAHFAINRIILSLLAGLKSEDTVNMNMPHEVIYRAILPDSGERWSLSYWDLRESGSNFVDGWIAQHRPENQPMGG